MINTSTTPLGFPLESIYTIQCTMRLIIADLAFNHVDPSLIVAKYDFTPEHLWFEYDHEPTHKIKSLIAGPTIQTRELIANEKCDP